MEFQKLMGDGPGRISVDMLDPMIPAGTTKTAVAPITAEPAGMSCEAKLFLGPNDTTEVVSSGRVPFTSTGASQPVRLTIAPAAAAAGASYHVYIDVFTDGYRFLAYKATEDVIVPGGKIDPITWE